MNELAVLPHLEALVDAQLPSKVTDDAFEFRHALTREAVYATLLKRQRVVYHALVADTQEADWAARAPRAPRTSSERYLGWAWGEAALALAGRLIDAAVNPAVSRSPTC